MPDCTVHQVADKFQPTLDTVSVTQYVGPMGADCDLASWVLEVDRNSDGDFIDDGEDVIDDVLAATGIRTFRGREQALQISPPRVGEMAFELDNRAGAYSAGSTVEAGRPARLQGHYNEPYDIWRGELDKPIQFPDWDQQSTAITAQGAMGKLAGTVVSTALYTSIRTDVAIGHLLDAAGWPAADRDLDTGKTTLVWWWLDEEDAWDALSSLMWTEGPGAGIYEGADGKLVFHNRHYLLTQTVSKAAQTEITDNGASPRMGDGFVLEDGLDNVINAATLKVVRRSAKSTEAIWSLGATLTLSPSEVVKYRIRRSSGDPFQGALTPVAATDYTITAGAVTPVLDRTSGASVELTLTAGAAGATMTGLQMRADPVTIDAENLVSNRVDASASITKYLTRTLPDGYVIRNEIAQTDCQDLVDAIVGWYRNGRERVRAPIYNNDEASQTAALARDLDDRINVDVTVGAIDVDRDFYVFGIETAIHSRRAAVTTWHGEEVNDNEYGAWGVGKWDAHIWGY